MISDEAGQHQRNGNTARGHDMVALLVAQPISGRCHSATGSGKPSLLLQATSGKVRLISTTLSRYLILTEVGSPCASN